jgi:hypothetical protein
VVAKGGGYFEATLAGRALARQMTGPEVKNEPHTGELSEREKEVLILLAWGHSNQEIAGQLSLSVKTVETYKLRIGEKRSRSPRLCRFNASATIHSPLLGHSPAAVPRNGGGLARLAAQRHPRRRYSPPFQAPPATAAPVPTAWLARA